MANPIRLNGPAGKMRRTKVARHAYYVPFDGPIDEKTGEPEGGWRFLPVDRVHAQMVEEDDDEGNPMRPVDLYASKGFVPLEYVQDKAALAKLPTNWREVANHGDRPVFAEPEKA